MALAFLCFQLFMIVQYLLFTVSITQRFNSFASFPISFVTFGCCNFRNFPGVPGVLIWLVLFPGRGGGGGLHVSRLVERVRLQRSETVTRRNKREETGGFPYKSDGGDRRTF